MCVVCVYTCACWCLQQPEEEGVSLKVELQVLWATWYGCWEATASPLQELQTLLPGEPAPSSSVSFYFILLSAYNWMFFLCGEKRPENRNLRMEVISWTTGDLVFIPAETTWQKAVSYTVFLLPWNCTFLLRPSLLDLTEVTESGEKTEAVWKSWALVGRFSDGNARECSGQETQR